ncbi:MAG: hypothetical protein LBK95_06000, partial [Bifidobacteriaceae bacterium]|nr:hypothetical protein [Bifidobacteriaceae bacterium]
MNEPAEQAVVAPGPAGRLPWWWNKTGAVVVVSVLVALVGFAVWTWGKDRCLWSPDVPFRALVNDPLADKELLGLELGHSREKRGSTPNNLIALNPMCGSVVDRSFTP